LNNFSYGAGSDLNMNFNEKKWKKKKFPMEHHNLKLDGRTRADIKTKKKIIRKTIEKA
jgi:hypothetical protein